jgi:hypothetical protein
MSETISRKIVKRMAKSSANFNAIVMRFKLLHEEVEKGFYYFKREKLRLKHLIERHVSIAKENFNLWLETEIA